MQTKESYLHLTIILILTLLVLEIFQGRQVKANDYINNTSKIIKYDRIDCNTFDMVTSYSGKYCIHKDLYAEDKARNICYDKYISDTDINNCLNNQSINGEY